MQDRSIQISIQFTTFSGEPLTRTVPDGFIARLYTECSLPVNVDAEFIRKVLVNKLKRKQKRIHFYLLQYYLLLLVQLRH